MGITAPIIGRRNQKEKIMLVKVIRPFLVGGGIVATEGSIINVTDTRAKELEKKGVVVPKLGGRSNVNDAFLQRQNGGKIGAEKQSPSLPVVPAPLTSETILKKRGRKRKSSQ